MRNVPSGLIAAPPQGTEERGFVLEEWTEVTWINFLTEFEEQVWPIFKRRGYKKDTALMVWKLNIMENTMDNVLATLEGDEH